MAKIPYLVRRGEIFQFRVRLPRAFFAILRRREISRSLRTKDLLCARRRGASLYASWLEIMEFVRSQPGLTGEQVKALVQDFIDTEFDKVNALQRAAAFEPELAESVALEEMNRSRLRKWLVQGIQYGNYQPVLPLVNEFLDARGLAVAPSSPLYAELMQRLAPVWLEALSSRPVEGQTTRPQPAICDGAVTAAESVTQTENAAVRPAASANPAPTKTIGELIEPYLQTRIRACISKSYVTELRTALSWFGQWFGDGKEIGSISPTEMRDYKDGLLMLPSNWSKKLKGVCIRDAAKVNADGHLPRLEVTALIAKRWQPVVDFLGWAESDLYISANPAAGLKIPVSRSHKKAKRRDPFGFEDLQKIFDAPVFRGAASDQHWMRPGDLAIRDDRFWIPLLALFTGGRRGELCPLEVGDVIERDRS